MRIALTITELHPGGAESCLVRLAKYLQWRGHVVEIWQLWPEPPRDRRALTDELDRCGIEWHSGEAVRPWHFPRVAKWLATEWRTFRPDIVQSFLFHANVAAALAIRDLDCLFFGGARVRQPQRTRWWLQRWATRRMVKLICVSQMVADHCTTTEKIAMDKIEVIPNGIDVDFPFETVSWDKLGVPSDQPVLLFVGRLDEQKGVEHLVKHADPLLEELQTHRLVLMGDGPRRSSVHRLVSRLKHRERVHLVGYQPRAIDWMRIAQMLVLPARYEGMPNVVLEAMLAEIPVVAFDVEGVEELLGASQLQIVEADNFPALADSIVRLARDDQLRAACGLKNRTRVAERFRADQQFARYETLYQEALDERLLETSPH